MCLNEHFALQVLTTKQTELLSENTMIILPLKNLPRSFKQMIWVIISKAVI